MELTVAQLAKRLGALLVADEMCVGRQITAVGPVKAASERDVTFVADDKHLAALGKSRAAAVIVARRVDGFDGPQLIVKDVNAALIQALNIFAPELKPPARGIAQSAEIGQDVRINRTASIGACVVIDDGVEIGENTVVGSGCKIGQNSQIGKNCRLDSNVVIYHNCRLGNNVIIQANSTIGSTGFGYAFIEGSHRLIPHNGGVIIEDFVEIGANCCVDRAKFGNTVIGAGTKIDNLVQIAHNVVIGKCCLIAGQVGISGSCRLGDGVVLGGQAGLTDNIELKNGVMVGGQAGVLNDVPAGQQLFGLPAIEIKEALRIIAITKRLPKMTEELKQLIKRLERLEAAKDDKR
jgi:UDP-3-O-[3-hydroxymyristoyl] glucosamine N-acyltransferase